MDYSKIIFVTKDDTSRGPLAAAILSLHSGVAITATLPRKCATPLRTNLGDTHISQLKNLTI